MIKMNDTHHLKSKHLKKKFKRKFAIPGTTLAVGTYGLTFANAAYNYMTIEYPNYVFREDLPATVEFQGELNATNRTAGVNSVCFSVGKQGSAANVFNFQFYQGKLTLSVYNSSSQNRMWQSNNTVISSASDGLHTFALSYDRTSTSYGTVIMVMDGVVIPNTLTGSGSGVITPNPGTRFWIGANAWAAETATTQHYAGDIAKFHYSPFARSANDMIKRQSDVNKLFPIDKYSTLDWNYRNGLKGWSRVIHAKRKY